MINQRNRICLIGFCGGALVTALILGLATISGLDNSMMLLLPGIVASALLFSTGTHSNYPIAFVIVAAIVDVFIYGAVVVFVFLTFKKRGTKKEMGIGNILP